MSVILMTCTFNQVKMILWLRRNKMIATIWAQRWLSHFTVASDSYRAFPVKVLVTFRALSTPSWDQKYRLRTFHDPPLFNQHNLRFLHLIPITSVTTSLSSSLQQTFHCQLFKSKWWPHVYLRFCIGTKKLTWPVKASLLHWLPAKRNRILLRCIHTAYNDLNIVLSSTSPYQPLVNSLPCNWVLSFFNRGIWSVSFSHRLPN